MANNVWPRRLLVAALVGAIGAVGVASTGPNLAITVGAGVGVAAAYLIIFSRD